MRLNSLFQSLALTLGVAAIAHAQTGISIGPGGSISLNGGGTGCGVSTACAISAGGTGATTAPGALTNLGAFPYPGATGIPFATSATASRAATAADISTLLGFTPQASLGFTPLNPANNLSDVTAAATALKNLGGAGWLTGTGAPAQTCSATVNTGYFYTNQVSNVYQCNNLVGAVYQWNLLGPTVTLTTTGTSGAASISGYAVNIPRYDQFLSLSTAGANCAAASYNASTGVLTVPACTAGSGTVTSVSAGTWPSWLMPTIANGSSTPQIAVSATPIPNSALAGPIVNSINGTGGAFTLTGTGVSCSGTACTVPSQSASNYPQRTYYLGPSGVDTAAGTAAAPWLTPNHPLNCGDVIIALPSTSYSSTNFGSGKWGTVTCPTGNGVAWLQCQTFDACKIASGVNGGGILVSASHWGVQGFEVSNGGASGAPCFAATPPTTSANIHHIIFANNVANGCGAAGISLYNNSTASFDYAAVIGNIVYNAAQNTTNCYAGIDLYQPVPTDTNPGTHIFVAGNFSYGNLDPGTCSGGKNGAGIIFDTFDGVGAGGVNATNVVYNQQGVIENNISVDNGGPGWQYQTYTKAATTFPTTYVGNNTTWGNNTDPNISTNLCGDGIIVIGYGLTATKNIGQTNIAKACPPSGVNTLYAFYSYDGSNNNDAIFGNWYFAVTGGSISGAFNDDGQPSPTLTNNTTGASSAFPSAANPSAPSCAGTANTVACMSQTGNNVVSNFSTTATGTTGLGYQLPSSTDTSDPYFPQWACNAGIPAGIVTKSCK